MQTPMFGMCNAAGVLQAFQQTALEHTPVAHTSYESLGAGGHRSAWGTWFEVSSPWAVMNSTFEVGLCVVSAMLRSSLLYHLDTCCAAHVPAYLQFAA